MKNLPALLLLCLCAFSFSNCGESEDCGPQTTWEGTLDNYNIYNELDVINGTRLLIYEDLATPEDICPDEHVSALFTVGIEETHGWSLPPHIIGKAYWGLYEDTVALWFNPLSAEFTGQIDDIGLKQAFGEDPGWIGLQLHFTFETQGGLVEDTTYIGHGVEYMYVDFNYYKFLL